MGAADWFSGIVLLDWGWVARSYTGFKRMWWLGMPSLVGAMKYVQERYLLLLLILGSYDF